MDPAGLCGGFGVGVLALKCPMAEGLRSPDIEIPNVPDGLSCPWGRGKEYVPGCSGINESSISGQGPVSRHERFPAPRLAKAVIMKGDSAVRLGAPPAIE